LNEAQLEGVGGIPFIGQVVAVIDNIAWGGLLGGRGSASEVAWGLGATGLVGQDFKTVDRGDDVDDLIGGGNLGASGAVGVGSGGLISDLGAGQSGGASTRFRPKRLAAASTQDKNRIGFVRC
jgi:hypothetical protein